MWANGSSDYASAFLVGYYYTPLKNVDKSSNDAALLNLSNKF